jgi:hypothetical protein
MRDKLINRIAELRIEIESGQAQLNELENRQQHVRQTLLRISGAIQVLEELLKEENVGGYEAGCPVNDAAPVSAEIR